MKTMFFLLAASLLLAGCASMEEAYHADREFGKDSQLTWDIQVAYPDYRYVYDQEGNLKNPETLDGISAENVMDVNSKTFAEKSESINIMEFGIVN